MCPIIAKIGPITIYSYGMFLAIACLVGIQIASIESARKNIKPDLVYDLTMYLVIGALMCARIYYIAFFNPGSFIRDPVSILKVWQGGLSIHGAILGGVIAGLLFCKIKKLSFWKMADIIAPSLIIGQAIGRIGCFLNGCCFGVPTESLFGVLFREGSLSHIMYGPVAVHPAQLYECLLNSIAFLFLWSMRKKVKFDGGIFLVYLMMYSSIRMITSSIRGDSFYFGQPHLKLAQIVSAMIFVIALMIFINRKKNA